MRANSVTVPVNIYASLAAYRLQHFFMTPVALGAGNYNPCDNNEQNMTPEKNTTAGVHSISEKIAVKILSASKIPKGGMKIYNK